MYTDQTTPKGTDLSGSILFVIKMPLKYISRKVQTKNFKILEKGLIMKLD